MSTSHRGLKRVRSSRVAMLYLAARARADPPLPSAPGALVATAPAAFCGCAASTCMMPPIVLVPRVASVPPAAAVILIPRRGGSAHRARCVRDRHARNPHACARHAGVRRVRTRRVRLPFTLPHQRMHHAEPPDALAAVLDASRTSGRALNGTRISPATQRLTRPPTPHTRRPPTCCHVSPHRQTPQA